MCRKYPIRVAVAVIALWVGEFVSAAPLGIETPLGTAFTYQGQLKEAGVPANDDYDMRFSLFDAVTGGTIVDGTLVFDGTGANPPPIAVADGLFTVALDFDDPNTFNGRALWLEIEVQPHGAGGYTTLSPRQPLTAAPYALGLQLPFHGGIDTLPLGTDAFSIRNNAATGHTVYIHQNSANAAAALRVNTGAAGPAIDVEGGYTGTNGTGALRVKSSDLFNLDYLLVDGSGLNHNGGPLKLQANTNSNVTMVEGGGKVGIGTNSPPSQLSIYENGNSSVVTVFTQDVANAGINIVTDYRSGDYTPGVFWSTTNNNATNPKAGIYLRESDAGTEMHFGTSNNYDTGITNDALVINPTGNVGIGTIAPAVKLHIVGGTDSALGGGGYIVTGSTTSTNISIDNNEIMARSNGAVATLTLNNDGGDVKFGGAINIGYAIDSCPAGTKVLGGGCFCGSNAILVSRPTSDGTGWDCVCDNGGFSVPRVICARVK